jgi:magnesium-transporting ATPase (P-type)
MKPSGKFLKTTFLLPVLAAFAPTQMFACAACYGRSDSPLASGINWGIFTLFCVIATVLGSIATFFVFIIRREAALAAKTAVENFPEAKA